MNEPRLFEPGGRRASATPGYAPGAARGAVQTGPGMPVQGARYSTARPAQQAPGASGFGDDVDLAQRRSATGFNYTGIDSLGVTVKGFIQTPDADLAEKELRRAGIDVVSISPRSALRQKARRPTMTDFAQLAEQFGDLMEVGEAPTQVCRLLAYSQTNKMLSNALISAAERIMNGYTIAEAFEVQRDDKGEPLFPITFICALRIGEEVGTTTDEEGETKNAFLLTLKRFAEAQKKAEAIKHSIRAALMYPIAVVVFCFVAMGIVLYFVMPRMVELYQGLLIGQDQTLPLLTRVMIAGSDFLLSWYGLIFLLALLIFSIWLVTWVRSPHGLDKLKVWSLRWPIFGSFFRQYFAAQTLRTLAMLSAGIPSMTERFTIAAETSTNPEYQEMLLHVRNRFMVESIDLHKLFAPYPLLMGDEFNGVLMTYEKTADMQGTFHNYAKVVETRAERELEKVLFWFQNFAIVPVGIFVGFVLVALYSPMFNLASKLGGG